MIILNFQIYLSNTRYISQQEKNETDTKKTRIVQGNREENDLNDNKVIQLSVKPRPNDSSFQFGLL